jgi:hypothetical protein
LDCCPHIFGMLGTNHFCIYHSFPTRRSPYSFGNNNTCWNWHFPIPNGVTSYMGHVTLGCLLSSPTFWKPSGLILSTVIGFFGGSPTQARVYCTFNRCSFRYHVNMYLLICRSRGKCLVINSSYHTFILSIFNPLLYNITYSSWLTTSYNCPSIMVLMWSYHWWFTYSFALMPLSKRTYNNPWVIHFKILLQLLFWRVEHMFKGSFPPFLSPHSTMSGYPYH